MTGCSAAALRPLVFGWIELDFRSFVPFVCVVVTMDFEPDQAQLNDG